MWINHVQRSNHPNRSTHCCCIPSIQGSSLHCQSGDPKHQPGDLDQRNRGFRELPCLRQLNKLKRAFPVVIVIWSRQTLTTTRRKPKPYYCIELQKKNLSLTEPSKQASILDFAINKFFYSTRQSPRLPPEADQALEKSRQSLDSPLTTKTSNSFLLAKQKNKKLLHSTNA